jgi:hypothetical protein
MTPLAEKISIDIDAIRLTQVFRDECSDSRQVLSLQLVFISNVLQLNGPASRQSRVHVEGSLMGDGGMAELLRAERGGEQRFK